MEYNTVRNNLVMPEYGRNIQRMVDYVRTIEDPEKRQKNAKSIIELMGVLNPHLKNVEDFRHKLWDHLFLIADFDLDVKSPYPIPTKEKLSKKPKAIPYPTSNRTNKHLGKNITAILEKALKETDEEKRQGYTQSIAYYMKLAYINWHREPVHDDMIKEELSVLSNGALQYNSSDGLKLRFDNRALQHKKNGNRKMVNNRSVSASGAGATNTNHHKKNKNRRNIK